MESDPVDLTALLRRWKSGDREAEGRLFEIVMPRLRGLARCILRREPAGSSLQSPVLINELYLRLAGPQIDWRDRAHFFAFSARTMRRYLIDRTRGKEHKGHRLTMSGIDDVPADGFDESRIALALAIDGLLEELGQSHQECVDVVEMKFFLGLTDNETADALSVPVRTIQRRWEKGREWLFKRLEPGQKTSQRSKTSST